MTWLSRYNTAHEAWFKTEYPNAYKDGHYLPPKKPKVETEKGLKDFIINFIKWSGGRATDLRKVHGVMVNESEQQASGTVLIVKKFKHTGVKKGVADVDSTINGRACKWEIKIGRDRPREEQLKEQSAERRAGGIYEFVSTPEEFLQHFDLLNI